MNLEGVDVIAQINAVSMYFEVFTFEWLNEQLVSPLAAVVGIPLDQLRYVLCLFLAYPLAVLFRMLPTHAITLKHVFNFVVGLFFAFFVLESGWIHSAITCVITYGLVRGGSSPKVVFVFNMVYITASHCYRMYVDFMGWSLDFTGPQMLLVIKFTSFAYDYDDGQTGDPTRQKFALKHMPTFLEFLGFTYCFPTFLAGPAFELKEYLHVIERPHVSAISSPVKAASVKCFTGIACMVLYTTLSPQFPISILNDKVTSELPLWRAIGLIWIAIFVARTKYYFAWKVAEGASVLCGYGYEPEKGTWNGVENMNISGFELAQSVREGSRSWNKATQAWLERYVYSRNGNSLMVTYFCSAFWHGFYPGYYLFFLSVPLATAVNRLAYKRLRPFFIGHAGLKKLYDGLSIITTSLCMNYLVIPFQVLSFENSLTALRTVYFSGHVFLIAFYLLLAYGLPAPATKAPKKTL